MSGYVCGEQRNSAGRPPVGWYQLKKAGQEGGRWFCSRDCVAAHIENEVCRARDLSPRETLQALAAIANRRGIAYQELTEERLMLMLEYAFGDLLLEIRARDAKDREGRVCTTEELIELLEETG